MENLETLLSRPGPKKKKSNAVEKTDLKRCAAYIRVSTEEQAENPEGSIRNQEDRIRQAVSFKNSNSEFGQLDHVFIDRGLSGKDMNRPELRAMLNRVSKGEIDLIIVSDLSRLSRSIRDFSQMWEFLQRAECGLWSLRENFDTSTAAGEMLLFSIMGLAQFERKQTSERVSANFQSRASRGLHNGGVMPFGYIPDPEKRGHLKIAEDEAKIVQAAFLAVLREGSIAGAAKWLNANKHSFQAPYRSGGNARGPRLHHFNVGNLSYLLQNPAYIGVRRYKLTSGKFQESKAAWPSIIDETTFDMVKTAIDSSRKRQIKKEGNRYPFLLSGKVFCEKCGQTMVGKSATGSYGKVPYYEHASQLRREGCIPKEERPEKCRPFRVQAKILERRAFEEIEKILRDPRLSETLFQKLQKRQKDGDTWPEVEGLQVRIPVIEAKIRGLLGRLSELPENIPGTVIYQEIERLETEKKSAAAKLHLAKDMVSLHQETVKPIDYERFLVRLLRMVTSEPTVVTRKAVVSALIHRVEIKEKGFKMGYYLGSGQIKTGEVLASPAFSFGKNNLSDSSLRFQNGGSCRDRTYDRCCVKALLYR